MSGALSHLDLWIYTLNIMSVRRLQNVSISKKSPRRVWYAHHAESDCVLKTYNHDELMEYVMYNGCDIIDFLTYKQLAEKYGQEI